MIFIQVLGWLCIAASAYFAVRMWSSDRRLQDFRSADVPARRYAFVPLRWHRDIYLPNGATLVDEVWRQWRRMCGAALLGMLLLGFIQT